jgi:hypothetical protein
MCDVYTIACCVLRVFATGNFWERMPRRGVSCRDLREREVTLSPTRSLRDFLLVSVNFNSLLGVMLRDMRIEEECSRHAQGIFYCFVVQVTMFEILHGGSEV